MFDIDDKRNYIDCFLASEINDRFDKAVLKLKEAICDDEHVTLVSKILAYSFFEEQAEAIELVKKLGLKRKDLLVFADDFETYEKEHMEERSWLNYLE